MVKLTKVCPNCKTENIDNVGVCKKCGHFLTSSDKGKKPRIKKKSNGRLMGWWNRLGTGGKISTVIIAVFIVIIASVIASQNTSTTSPANPTAPTTSTVPTTSSIDNSVNATFNNSVISFQYPKNLEVKNTSADHADGAIIVTNNGAANNGILVTSQEKLHMKLILLQTLHGL